MDKIQLIKEEIERRISQCERLLSADLLKRERDEILCVLHQHKEILQFIDSLQEEPSEDLDKLVISLEETIGTSPHSREVIKEHLQKAAELGRNHFEDKSEMVSEDLEEEIKRYFKEEEWIKKPVAEIARHFADWQYGKDFNDLLSSEMEFPKEFYAKGKADTMKEMKETLQTEYEKGRFDMMEEMMKNTVLETKVMMDCDGDGIETSYEEWLTLENTEIPYIPDNLGLKEGDMVKIIIVKPGQQ